MYMATGGQDPITWNAILVEGTASMAGRIKSTLPGRDLNGFSHDAKINRLEKRGRLKGSDKQTTTTFDHPLWNDRQSTPVSRVSAV